MQKRHLISKLEIYFKTVKGLTQKVNESLTVAFFIMPLRFDSQYKDLSTQKFRRQER